MENMPLVLILASIGFMIVFGLAAQGESAEPMPIRIKDDRPDF